MEFIIVLGNSNVNIRRARVKRAVEHYRILVAKHYKGRDFGGGDLCLPLVKFIFSGKGGSQVTEAEDMKNMAVKEFHILEDVCMIDTKSMDTHENLVNSLELIKQWLNPTFYHGRFTFTISTSLFHAPRAMVMASNVLSTYGDIAMIYDNDKVTKELEEKEKQLLDHYVKNIMLPAKTNES